MSDFKEEMKAFERRRRTNHQDVQTPAKGEESVQSKPKFRLPGPVWSLIWITLGILLASSLYTKGGNVLGVIGKYTAEYMYTFFGAGAWVVSAALIWIGGYRLFHKGHLPHLIWIGWYGLMISVCVLASVFSVDPMIVGKLGQWFGHDFFNVYLGKVGSTILFVSLYVCCFIYALGYKPYGYFKAVYLDVQEWLRTRKEKSLWDVNQSKTLKTGDLAQRLQEGNSESSPGKKRVSKKESFIEEWSPEESLVNKFEKENIEVEPDGQIVLDLPIRPMPEIIDASQTKAKKSGNAVASFKPALSPATGEYENYVLPPLSMLHLDEKCEAKLETDKAELLRIQESIIETLLSFKIPVTAGNITKGPTITRYEVYPEKGLRVSAITQVASDIARATKAERINILAPIPGKDTVGIEIANSKRVSVPLRELLEDDNFVASKKRIPVAIGKDVYGNAVIGDLAAMPHLLVAGATGSGKSVCLNSIICSILFRFRPDELRFILADPKVVELKIYEKLPHLIVPVVTDAKKVVGALRWAVNEMEHRYKIFAEVGVRNLESFNSRPIEEKLPRGPIIEEEYEEDPERMEAIAASIEGDDYDPAPLGDEDDYYDDDEEIPDKFPYIVVIVDEFADFMQTASSDMESYIARLTAKARAAGIHLILATQTPRKDVVTGVIKANIPSRIALSVSSATDSRIILDAGGAEKLVGKGDLLFLPPGTAKLERAQGCFVSDAEIEEIVAHCASQAEQKFQEEIQAHIELGGDDDDDAESGGGKDLSRSDEVALRQCIDIVREEQKASTSLFQRRLSIGYGKASRMIDIMESRGLIGPYEGPSKEREIFIK